MLSSMVSSGPTRIRLPLLAAVVALFFAACSGSNGEAPDVAEADQGVGGADTPVLESDEADPQDEDAAEVETEAAVSLAALEQQWAAARAEVVEAIEFGGFGVDEDNVLRGPGGLEVDLDDCPADWSDEAGIDGDLIRVAHTSPITGNLFAYGHLGSGMQVYFDWVNDNGGIGGRQIQLSILDDGYNGEQTAEVVEELVEEDPPFLVTTLGSPTSLEVYGDLNDRCIPQPFVMSSHPAFGDPEGHPWTTGLQLSQTSEAVIWGNWMKENLQGDLPVRVGAVVMDNEFGVVYEEAFAEWADANSDVVSEFVPVRHNPQAADLGEELTELVDSDPDIYIAMTTGDPCLFAVQAAGSSGLLEQVDAAFTSSTCQQTSLYLAPAGEVADGLLVVNGGGKSTADPRFADEPFIAFANGELVAAGLDTSIGFFGTGFTYYGWAHVEAMRIADELDGGLTRSNLLLAIRSLDLVHPMYFEGIRFSFNGNQDGFAIEGSQISQFDAEAQAWRRLGPIIDVNGLSPSCAWTGQRC